MTKRGYIGSRLRVGRLGLTQAPVGGFPDCPKGFPILSTDPPPDSEVWVSQITVSVRRAWPSLKYCLRRADL